MKDFTKQTVLAVFTVMLLLLATYKSTAQLIPKADNSIHDRMYALMQKSEQVILPLPITEKIKTVNISNPHSKKAMFTQTSVMKVLYNSNLSKEDIVFFSNEILKSRSASIGAISADIKKLVTK